MRLTHDQQQQKLTQMFLEKKSEDDPDRYPRPPRLGFWDMPRPPGFRSQAGPGGETRAGQKPMGLKGKTAKKADRIHRKRERPAARRTRLQRISRVCH